MSEAFLRFDNARDAQEPMQRHEAPKPYVFHEFPKWVTPPGGEPVIVESAEEEARVMGRPAAPEPAVHPSPAVAVRAPTVARPSQADAPRESGDGDAIAGRLVRAARGLLGWSQADLAQHAGLSIPTVQKIETAEGDKGSAASVAAVECALSDAGVSWCDDADQCGVWMQKGERDRSAR